MTSHTRRSSYQILLLLQLLVVAASATCNFKGQLFCDKCWDGAYTDKTDYYIKDAKVLVNCTVVKKFVRDPVYFWGSSGCDSSGNFKAPLSGASNFFGEKTAEDAFLNTLYSRLPIFNTLLSLLSGSYVVGCTVSVTNCGDCCNLAYNDGQILAGGKTGNGWTSSNVDLTAYEQSADLSIVNSKGSLSNGIALTPSKKPATCPGGTPSPPPPGTKGDPHFTGADGSHFDFSGEPNTHFCLLSDAHVHINAYYGGRYGVWGTNTHKALTWIRKLGIMWGHHTISLEAREGARWQYDNGYMSKINVDGVSVTLKQAGDSVKFVDNAIEIIWLAAKVKDADDLVDIYVVKVKGAFTMRITVRPEIELLRTAGDGVVHFDFELLQTNFSENAHGVLGQTFRADHKHKLAEQKLQYSELLHTEVIPGDNAEGYLDGSVDNYKSSGLLKADCAVSHFAQASYRDLETAQAIELASGGVVSTMGSNRKMMKPFASS